MPSLKATSTRTDGQVIAALTVVTLALLTSGWFFSGQLVSDHTPPLAVAVGRVTGSGIALLGIALVRRTTRTAMVRVASRRWVIIKLAFIGYFIYFVGTMLGLARIGASKTVLVVALLPCVTFVVGIIAFSEKLSFRKAFGSIAAIAGAVAYAQVTAGGNGASEGDLLIGGGWVLLATVAFAVYSYLYRDSLHDVTPLAVLPILFGMSALMLLPLAAIVEPLSKVTAGEWVGSLLLGAVLTAPVYVTAHELVLRRGPLYMAMVSLVVPFFVRLSEWVFGGAPPLNLPSVLTMAFCLAGVALTVKAPQSPPSLTTLSPNRSREP